MMDVVSIVDLLMKDMNVSQSKIILMNSKVNSFKILKLTLTV